MMNLSSTTIHRARRLVPCAMAAVLALSVPAHGQDDAQVKQLEAENAALRQRIAQLTGQPVDTSTPAAPASPTAPAATPQPTAASGPTPSADTIVLSPFDVSEDKDYGYLKTNSVTATRVGMPIQEIPMYVQVLSSDFIQDTNMTQITDLLRYTAAGSGDNSFRVDIPSNSATSQGIFTLRGFPVNNILRDGVFNYNYYNMDNVDRVEIVQGPAAVFYGQGYPGGVINMVTKQPEFHYVPTTITWTYGQAKEEKIILDTNEKLSDKAAMRIVTSTDNEEGQRIFEFQKNFTISPSLALIPFGNDKLKITLGFQEDQGSFNLNNGAWYYSPQWFQSYANPSAALIAAGGTGSAAGEQARIFNSIENWGVDMRVVNGNPEAPIYTAVSPYGYETELNGQRIKLENFNFFSRGAYDKHDDNIATLKVESSPFEWLDLRYVYTKTQEFFDSVQGVTTPNADGMTWNTVASISTPGYHNFMYNHQFDAVIKEEVGRGKWWDVKNKLLGGFVFQPWLQQYNTAYPQPNYETTPGATNPVANPNNAYVSVQQQNTTSVPSGQVLYNRAGQILQVNQVYSMWDPAVNPAPDVAVLYPNYNATMDGYKAQENDWYLNDQVALLNDKLNLLGGFRQQTNRTDGQNLTANFPYFSPPPYAYANPTAYPASVYNYSASYEESNFTKVTGNSYMAGVSYDVTPGVTLYVTTSKTFKLNTGTVTTQTSYSAPALIAAALQNGNGSFVYRGQTITSVAQGVQVLQNEGALNNLLNESGINWEGGIKTSLLDNKIVTTISIFRGTRMNQKLDDPQAQAAEPFNYSTTLFAPGSPYYNTRNLRWYGTGQENLVYGGEFEGIITPIRAFQTVINFGYLPTARTVYDPRYSAYYASQSPVNAAFNEMYYTARLENVPKYSGNIFNKYTIQSGMLRGAWVTLGARYNSERVYSRSFDWNPQEGGWQEPQYVVFDGGVGYGYELLGYHLKTDFQVQNFTNKTYYEGGVVPSEKMQWQLINTIAF